MDVDKGMTQTGHRRRHRRLHRARAGAAGSRSTRAPTSTRSASSSTSCSPARRRSRARASWTWRCSTSTRRCRRVRERRPDVPPRLAAAVERALAKDPADRFESMDAFVAELRAWSRSRGARRRRGRHDRDPARARLLRGRGRRRASRGGATHPVGLRCWPASSSSRASRRCSSSSATAPARASAAHAYRAGEAARRHVVRPAGRRRRGAPSEVPIATDGNPSTYWTTSSYRDGAGSLGKDGVGIVLDARRRRPSRGRSSSRAIRQASPRRSATAGALRARSTTWPPPTRRSGRERRSTRRRGGPLLALWITSLGANRRSTSTRSARRLEAPPPTAFSHAQWPPVAQVWLGPARRRPILPLRAARRADGSRRRRSGSSRPCSSPTSSAPPRSPIRRTRSGRARRSIASTRRWQPRSSARAGRSRSSPAMQ